MVSKMQYQLNPSDLQAVLALVRSRTLAGAGERLGQDASTVFRTVQRIERGLGQALFERSRTGYQPGELAQALGEHAEQMELALESARAAAQLSPEQVAGRVRITTTDTILHALVAPALSALRAEHPLIGLDLHAGNEMASLARHDADIALRATRRPPAHLVGRHLGAIRVALYAARNARGRQLAKLPPEDAPWVAPDDALPDHPTVVWRKRHWPRVAPALRVNSILTVAECVAAGLGIGLLPLFLAQGRGDLRRLGEPIEACQTELWLLTRTESRHLRRVSAVYAHLAQTIALP